MLMVAFFALEFRGFPSFFVAIFYDIDIQIFMNLHLGLSCRLFCLVDNVQ